MRMLLLKSLLINKLNMVANMFMYLSTDLQSGALLTAVISYSALGFYRRNVCDPLYFKFFVLLTGIKFIL